MLNFFQITLALGVVLAMIYLSAKLVQKISSKHLPQKSILKVLASVAVGRRERVILVEAHGQQFLLGVGPGQVRLLTAVSDPSDAATPVHPSPDASPVLSEDLDEQTMAMRTPWLQHQLSKLNVR